MRHLNGLLVGLGLALAALTALPAAAQEDPEHGIGLLKGCASPREIGDSNNCTFTAAYLDETLVDTIEITDVQDTVMSAGGPVVIPASGISIDSIDNGPLGPTNTTCQVSNPAILPCRLCPAFSTGCGLNTGDPGFDAPGQVKFRSNSYVITAADAAMANPLQDIARVERMDNCESGVSNCTMAPLGGFIGSETVIEFPFVEIEKTCTECDLFSEPDPFQSLATVTVTNTGTAAATNCRVLDIFNPGPDETVLIDTMIDVLEPNVPVEFVDVPTPAHMDDALNTVTVTCDPLDAPAQTSDSAEADCPCDFEPPIIRLEKECTDCDLGSTPPFLSEVTLTLANDGTGPATNCRVIDTFDGEEIYNELFAVVPPGTLPPIVFPTPPHDDPELNQAMVTCDALPPPAVTMDEAEALCECDFEPPDVGISKDCMECSADTTPPFRSPLSITVTNTGTGPATDCMVVDTFDPGGPLEEIIFATTIDELPAPPDPNSTMVFDGILTPPHNEDVDNEVTVTCAELPLGTTMAEDEDVCECEIVPPFIEVIKECGLCDPDQGNSAPIKLTVRNTGTGPATNCVLVDTFDPEGDPLEIFNMNLGTIPAPPDAGSEQEFEFLSPPILTTVNNRATITCDEEPPPAQTMDIDEAACVCRPFVPPCRGLECNICIPDQLKGDDDDNETGF